MENIKHRRPLKDLQGKYTHYQSLNNIESPWKGNFNLCEILIRKEYNQNYPEVLIKNIGDTHFRELSGGMTTSNSGKTLRTLGDPIKDWLYPEKLEKIEFILSTQEDLAHISSPKDFWDIEFLRVRPNFNYEGEYENIPDFREVAYAFKGDGIYLYMDQSKFRFSYSSMKLFIGSSIDTMELVEFSDFVRYRDGGTTQFRFVHKNKEYPFYSPSRLNTGERVRETTIIGKLTELTDQDIQKIQSKFNILIYPK